MPLPAYGSCRAMRGWPRSLLPTHLSTEEGCTAEEELEAMDCQGVNGFLYGSVAESECTFRPTPAVCGADHLLYSTGMVVDNAVAAGAAYLQNVLNIQT